MAQPLLQVRNLTDALQYRARAGDGRRPGVVRHRRRRDGGHRRRVRLGQERDGAVAHAPHPVASRPHRDRRGDVRGPRSLQARRRRHPRHPRQQDRHDLPGADVLAQSGPDRRHAGGRAHQPASRRGLGQGAGAGQGADGSRAHPRCREPARLLPAPVFRRHAPARHDRHGARLPAATDDRRRADHRARRHRAGADPRSAQGADARDRLVAAADHARPGVVARYADRVAVMYGGRIVETAPARDLYRAAAASLHAGPDGLACRGSTATPASAWRRSRASRRIWRNCRRAAPSLPAAASVTDICRSSRPPLVEVGARHLKACFDDIRP